MKVLVSAILLAFLGHISAQSIPKVSRYFSGTKRGISFYSRPFSYSWHYSLYDGRTVSDWIGGDGEIPEYVVSSLTLKLSGVQVEIPQHAFWDFFDPQVQGAEPYILEDPDFIYLVIQLSDGAGSAKVWLRFNEGKYVGRRIETHTAEQGAAANP